MTGRWTPAYERQFDPDHELADEPACRRWAWLDLCNLTQHRPVTRMIDYKPVRVERGQFIASERFLAERWGWSRGKVQRFLTYLEHPDVRKIVAVKRTRGGTIYTLPTFEKYALGSQEMAQKADPPTDPPTDPLPGHRNGKNGNGIHDWSPDGRSTAGTTDGSSADPLPVPNTICKEEERTTKTPMSKSDEPISDLWGVWLEELGGDPPHPRLTTKRRQKLRDLYREQLRKAPDPVALFRDVLRAVKRSEHHMSKRAYQMPDSLFRNEERRDTWVQAALNPDRPSKNGSGDPYRILHPVFD